MKSNWLKILNPIVLLLAANQFATGFRPGLYVKGTFRFAHKRMSILLLIALAVHLGLNNAWVRRTYFRQRPSPERAAASNENPSDELPGVSGLRR